MNKLQVYYTENYGNIMPLKIDEYIIINNIKKHLNLKRHFDLEKLDDFFI